MVNLTPSRLKRAAIELLDASQTKALEDQLSQPVAEVEVHTREAQNALRAAIESAGSSLWLASTVNRLLKVSEGKALQGQWSVPAQDNLRAALLFAGAGLDRALKRLVEDSLGRLVASDALTAKKLAAFATTTLTDRGTGTVNPGELVELLMGVGETPRDILTTRWIRVLTDGSAQSAERITEIATALGIVDADLRKRIAPQGKKSPLELAFIARNEIAHELDVTKPQAEVRQRLESIRRYRGPGPMRAHCVEILDVTQSIINDVALRLA